MYNITNIDSVYNELNKRIAYKNSVLLKHNIDDYIEYLKIKPFDRYISDNPLTHYTSVNLKDESNIIYKLLLKYIIINNNITFIKISFYKL